MNLLKKGYQYLFYKFYRFFEFGAFSAWWSEWKAATYVNVICFFLIFSSIIYFRIFINPYINLLPNKFILVSIASLVMGFNYYLFIYKDKWKLIVKEYDKLPNIKNRIGGVLVWSFVILVIANLVYAFYLMSQIDWSQYR